MVGAVVLLYLWNTHYTCRGGASAYVDACGIFFITLNPLYSTGNWVFGAALSFRLSTHYTLRGGHSGLGVDCGEFFVGVTTADSYTSLRTCAALLYWYTLCCSWWCF